MNNLFISGLDFSLARDTVQHRMGVEARTSDHFRLTVPLGMILMAGNPEETG
jgi:hypothetical protein